MGGPWVVSHRTARTSRAAAGRGGLLVDLAVTYLFPGLKRPYGAGRTAKDGPLSVTLIYFVFSKALNQPILLHYLNSLVSVFYRSNQFFLVFPCFGCCRNLSYTAVVVVFVRVCLQLI